MTESFNTWTEYDNWLIQNYEKYAMISLDEKDGKVVVDFIEKAEWEKEQRAKGNM